MSDQSLEGVRHGKENGSIRWNTPLRRHDTVISREEAHAFTGVDSAVLGKIVKQQLFMNVTTAEKAVKAFRRPSDWKCVTA